MATFESNTVAGGPAGYSTTSSLKGLPSTGLNDKLRQALLLLAKRRVVAQEPPYRYPPSGPGGGGSGRLSNWSSPANHGDPGLNDGHTWVMGGGAQDTMAGHYTQGPNTNVVGGASVSMPPLTGRVVDDRPLPPPSDAPGAGAGAGYVAAKSAAAPPPSGAPTPGTQAAAVTAAPGMSAPSSSSNASVPPPNAGQQALAKAAAKPMENLPPPVPSAPPTAGQLARIFDPMTQTIPTQGATSFTALPSSTGTPSKLAAYMQARAVGSAPSYVNPWAGRRA